MLTSTQRQTPASSLSYCCCISLHQLVRQTWQLYYCKEELLLSRVSSTSGKGKPSVINFGSYGTLKYQKAEQVSIITVCFCSSVNNTRVCMQMLQRVTQIHDWCQTLTSTCLDRKKSYHRTTTFAPKRYI